MDDEYLLRWIPPAQLVPGEFKVQSEMFRKLRFSADRQALKSLEQFLEDNVGKHAARFKAACCRTLGYGVEPRPLPDNRAHAIVESHHLSNTELRRAAKALRDSHVELIQAKEI